MHLPSAAVLSLFLARQLPVLTELFHVSIQMPTLDKKNLDKTIKHADTVIRAAMAPTDPSSQDYKVAAEARAIRSQALAMKNDSRVGKKLDYQA